MKQKIVIDTKLMDLNKYINLERGNRYAAASIKKKLTEEVCWLIKSQKIKPYDTPVRMSFVWYVPSKRCDADNYRFGAKFVMDALVMAGVIANDNLNCVVGFDGDEYVVSKDRAGVDVLVYNM